MSIDDFQERPWLRSHNAYDRSIFAIKPAPEFATSEVLLASLYRAVGFPGYSEAEVPKAGRDFDKRAASSKRSGSDMKLDADAWNTVLHGVLESPKQKNQSSKRFLSLCPMVPDVSLYSGSARLAGNPWNPGELVKRMLQLGCKSNLEAENAWDALFAALSVQPDDDIWARWLETEFARRRKGTIQWRLADLAKGPDFTEKTRIRYPAKQFARDLGAVIAAKPAMTRRQWLTLLDAIVRIGSVAHVLWLCRVNEKIWRATAAIMGHGDYPIPQDANSVRAEILEAETRYLSYGAVAGPLIRDLASAYLVARLGVNTMLWSLSTLGVEVGDISSADALVKYFRQVETHRAALQEAGVMDLFRRLRDAEARTINCKKGIGSNLVEFGRYCLQQRTTSNETLRGYDQSYFVHQRSNAHNAPWVVSLGPVAILCVVHCCLHGVAGPRSVHRLSQHLAAYGLEVDADDISSSDLGLKLRMLGLVLDSPDAESGMLLVHPFSTNVGVFA